MACFYHSNRQATSRCVDCGKHLCSECGGAFNPPTCLDCISAYASKIKTEMITSIAISVVLMIAGVVIIKKPEGILLAGIPYGWSILNSITPTMFLWMSWVGWIIYYVLKLVIAYFIGLVALPFKLFKWISELRRVSKLQESANRINNNIR